MLPHVIKNGEPLIIIGFQHVVVPRVCVTPIAERFNDVGSVIPDDLSPVTGLRVTNNKLVNIAQGAQMIADAMK